MKTNFDHLNSFFDRIEWEQKLPESHREWKYPENQSENLRFLIFFTLWSRGYYLTTASKFGGDYLCYPGDPLEYHASYVVIVKDAEEGVTPLDLISYGRLGVTVKKTPILATLHFNNLHTNTEKTVKNDNNNININNNNNNDIIPINDPIKTDRATPKCTAQVKFVSIDWQGVT